MSWLTSFLALFAWREEFEAHGFSFQENAVTGKRRALIAVTGHAALPLRHEWLRPGDEVFGHHGVRVVIEPSEEEPHVQQKPGTVTRDTISGEFVAPEEALRRPNTTVTETVKRKPPRKAAKKAARKK